MVDLREGLVMARQSVGFQQLLICTLIVFSAGTQAEPIHDAAVDGDTDLVQRLLDDGADVNATDAAGTPLQWALFVNRREVVRLHEKFAFKRFGDRIVLNDRRRRSVVGNTDDGEIRRLHRLGGTLCRSCSSLHQRC